MVSCKFLKRSKSFVNSIEIAIWFTVTSTVPVVFPVLAVMVADPWDTAVINPREFTNTDSESEVVQIMVGFGMYEPY
jgi:hypothetical protein